MIQSTIHSPRPSRYCHRQNPTHTAHIPSRTALNTKKIQTYDRCATLPSSLACIASRRASMDPGKCSSTPSRIPRRKTLPPAASRKGTNSPDQNHLGQRRGLYQPSDTGAPTSSCCSLARARSVIERVRSADVVVISALWAARGGWHGRIENYYYVVISSGGRRSRSKLSAYKIKF